MAELTPAYADYKMKCIEGNKCTRCPRQNDNPSSLTCRACTEKHRLLQQRLHRRAKLRVVIA